MIYFILFLVVYIMLNGIVKITKDYCSLYKWITKKRAE